MDEPNQLAKYVLKKEPQSLAKLLPILSEYISGLRIKHGNVGYLSGPITADGSIKINSNLDKLRTTAAQLRATMKYPVFSPPDLVSTDLYWRLGGDENLPSDWEHFWRKLLQSGSFSDIFMLPGWERSTGARDEQAVAAEIGLVVHYLK